MPINSTRLLGLNVNTNAKDLQDNELSDMTNLQLLKTGELVRRKGLRPLVSEKLVNTSEGKTVIPVNTRIKYRQVYTTSKEYLDVFAIGNKVWIYDQNTDRFSLLYEAPGDAEVDIDSYLGYILATSQDSNLAILKRSVRSVFLIKPGDEVIKAKGAITANAINFVTEDSIDDANIKDIDIDQALLYSVSQAAATRTETITPSGQEITGITLGTANTYYQDILVRIGYEDNHEGSWDTDDGSSGTYAIKCVPGSAGGIESATIKEIVSKNISDFPVSDSYYEQDIETFVRHQWKIIRSTKKGVIYSGLKITGNAISSGSVRPVAGAVIPMTGCSDISWFNNKTVYFTERVTINSYITDTMQDENTYYNVFLDPTNPARVLENNGVIVEVPYYSHYVASSSGYIKAFRKGSDGNHRYYTRPYKYEKSKVVYSALLWLSGTETTPHESNIVDVTDIEGTTVYTLTVEVPSHSLSEEPWATLAVKGDGADWDYSYFVNNHLSDLDTDGYAENSNILGDELIHYTGGKVQLYLYRPYYTIKTPFTETNKKYMLDAAGQYPEFQYSIKEYIGIDPIYLDVFTGSACITVEFADYGSGSETEYTIEPDDGGATALKSLTVKAYAKDNLDIEDTLITFYSDNTTAVAIAKNTNFFMYIDDDAGAYLMAFTFEGDTFKILATYDMSGITGAFVSMRSFTAHTGRQYIAVLTAATIYIYRLIQNVITEITTYTIASVLDMAFMQHSNQTHIYGFKAQNNTTVLLKLNSTDANELVFDATLYSDPGDGANEIPFYVNDNTHRSTIITFVKDDSENWRIVGNDIAGQTPDRASRYLEFQVNGSSVTTYTKLLSDFSISHIEQVKPYTTPVRPTLTAAGADVLTGRYQYFYVVKEWSGAGNTGSVLYESYLSEFSAIADITALTITVDAQTDGYVQNDDATLSVEVEIYRSKITDYNENVKATDFFLVYDNLSATAGSSTGLWTLTAQADTISDATALTKEKYKGFSDTYPRCRFVEVFQNVVYIGNDVKYRNNIYFSDIYDPTTWQPQKTLTAELFSNDEITGLAQNDGLYVFTRDSVSLVSGTGTNLAIQTLTKEIGCVDERTLQVIQNQLFFLSERGFYKIRNYEYGPIDVAVSKITHEFTFGAGIISYYDNFTQEYRIIYDNNKMLNYSVPLNTWFKFEYPYDKIIIGFSRENPETDIPDNILIIRNEDADGNDTYRMLVEDGLISYDFLRGFGSTSKTTEAITSKLYTKKFDVGNGYADKVWRRFFVEALDSHGITASISVDDGEFTEMVNQQKRDYFNDVPLIWFKFRELYSSDVVDYGTRGIVGKSFDTLLNQDGKIDRCHSFTGGAYMNIGDVPQMNRWTACFWFLTSVATQQCVLSDGTEITAQDDDEYVASDFTNDILDTYNIHALLPVQSDADDAKLKIGNYEWDSTATTYGAAAYATGTDKELNSPNNSYNQNKSFVPCLDDSAYIRLYNGTKSWDHSTDAGINKIYSGDLGAGSYGTIYFDVSPGVGLWTSFFSASSDGIQRIYFPGLTTNDRIGGYVDFVYDNSNYTTAFNGNGNIVIIAKNGSVYTTSITGANLVTRWDGVAGPAGGGAATDTNINEWTGQSVGTTAGAVTIETEGTWDTFSTLDNGLYYFNVTQDIYYEFKRIPFYYHAAAWAQAFDGNDSVICISKSGAVYKDTIEPFNLVVNESGLLGMAGIEHRGEVTILVNGDNMVNGKVWDGSTEVSVSGGTASTDTWNHVAISYDETSMRLYVNGALAGTTTHGGVAKPFDVTRDALIGKYLGQLSYLFEGKLDDFRIYDSTLTAQNISDIYDYGRQYQQYEQKTYVPPKTVCKGRSAKFKLESDEYMQIRQIAMETRTEEMR